MVAVLISLKSLSDERKKITPPSVESLSDEQMITLKVPSRIFILNFALKEAFSGEKLNEMSLTWGLQAVTFSLQISFNSVFQ